MKILMLHGINHNMFGKRDPAQYGTITLAQIDAQLAALGKELGVQVESFQTNSEAAMCERIHQGFAERVDAVLINAAAMRSPFSRCRSSRSPCRTSTRASRSGTSRYSPRSSADRSAASASTAICSGCARPCQP